MFVPRKPYKRTVVCPCGQPIGETRAAAGARRCSVCVERFERSTPAAQKQQPQLFEDARPSTRQGGNGAARGKSEPTAAPPSKPVPPKPEAPRDSAPAAPPAPRPDPVAATNARAAELRAANQRAAADRRMQRYTTLRAAGVPREEAMSLVDAEENAHGKADRTTDDDSAT